MPLLVNERSLTPVLPSSSEKLRIVTSALFPQIECLTAIKYHGVHRILHEPVQYCDLACFFLPPEEWRYAPFDTRVVELCSSGDVNMRFVEPATPIFLLSDLPTIRRVISLSRLRRGPSSRRMKGGSVEIEFTPV